MNNEEKFNFFVPLTFEKATDKKTGKVAFASRGIASTNDEDTDEEILEPDGFDLSYFKKYGAKFPASQFSRHNIETVTINGVQEISYHFALVDTIVTFADGHAARTLLKLEKKFPQGWKVQSWEILQTR